MSDQAWDPVVADWVAEVMRNLTVAQSAENTVAMIDGRAPRRVDIETGLNSEPSPNKIHWKIVFRDAPTGPGWDDGE